MDKEAKLKIGCEYVISNIYQCYNKPIFEEHYVKEQLNHYKKLITKLPPQLKPFQSLVDIVITCDDHYRIVWLGNKLHNIYLGKEYKPHLPYLWEDEVDLETICKTILSQ